MMKDNTQEKWDKRKQKVKELCPVCFSSKIRLNRSCSRTFNRYWLECWVCHWCEKRANTINGAIRNWNNHSTNPSIEDLQEVRRELGLK